MRQSSGDSGAFLNEATRLLIVLVALQRGVPLLARLRLIRLQNRVDDAGKTVQLRPPHRRRPAIPRRRRIASPSSSPSGGRCRTDGPPRDGSDVTSPRLMAAQPATL